MNKHAPITITLTRPLAPTVKDALTSLRQTFPDAFTHPPRPLADDSLEAAQSHFAEQHSKKSIRRALSAWCNQVDYLRAVVAHDAHCVQLDGSDAGPVKSVQRDNALRRLALKGCSPTAPPTTVRRAERRSPPVNFFTDDAIPATPSSPAVEHSPADGPRISIRQRPKLDPALLDRVHADETLKTGQRPKLTLKKRTPESSPS